MIDKIQVNLGTDHIFECTECVLGREGEGNTTRLEVNVPENLRDYAVHLDFEIPSGDTLRTPKLKLENGVAYYDVVPFLLAVDGEIKAQAVLIKDEKTWKSSIKKYVNLHSINAYGEIPNKEDIFTQATRSAERIEEILASLGGAVVFGRIDENTDLILAGDLPLGTYTAKYEMADGSTVDIGVLEYDGSDTGGGSGGSGELIAHLVTKNGTNCTISGSEGVFDGENYTATVTVNSGYEFSASCVTVTMVGNSNPSYTVSGNTITVNNVTGNIVITVVATATATAEPKNFALPLSVGRLSNSASGYVTTSSAEARRVTEYVPVQNGDIVTLSGVDASASTSINTYMVFDSSKAKLADISNWSSGTSNSYVNVKNHTNSGCEVEIISDAVSYIRFCSTPAGADEAVVVNIKRNGEWATE